MAIFAEFKLSEMPIATIITALKLSKRPSHCKEKHHKHNKWLLRNHEKINVQPREKAYIYVINGFLHAVTRKLCYTMQVAHQRSP